LIRASWLRFHSEPCVIGCFLMDKFRIPMIFSRHKPRWVQVYMPSKNHERLIGDCEMQR